MIWTCSPRALRLQERGVTPNLEVFSADLNSGPHADVAGIYWLNHLLSSSLIFFFNTHDNICFKIDLNRSFQSKVVSNYLVGYMPLFRNIYQFLFLFLLLYFFSFFGLRKHVPSVTLWHAELFDERKPESFRHCLGTQVSLNFPVFPSEHKGGVALKCPNLTEETSGKENVVVLIPPTLQKKSH